MYLPDFLSMIFNVLHLGSIIDLEQDNSVCNQPRDFGPCLSFLPRYWYNEEIKQCRLFLYGGCGGNENNFEDEAQCLQRCGEKTEDMDQSQAGDPNVVKPIADSPDVKNPNVDEPIAENPEDTTTEVCTSEDKPTASAPDEINLTIEEMNEENPADKPDVEKTIEQVPVAEQTEVEKASETEGDVCRQPKDVGPCRSAIEKYWHNYETKQCEEFLFGGCGGNKNNFDDENECKKACAPADNEDAPKVALDTPQADEGEKSDAASDTTDVCSQPKLPGPCRALYERYWYNKEAEKCEKFAYGGCDGNGNNFKDESECIQACSLEPNSGKTGEKEDAKEEPESKPEDFETESKSEGTTITSSSNTQKPVDICRQPVEAGECQESLPRFWYNADAETCENFTYSGCNGNENNFIHEDDCKEMCMRSAGEHTAGGAQRMMTNVCDEPKKVGPCRVSKLRYWYNKVTKQCKQFLFGGCHGNGNNFIDEDKCVETCVPSAQESDNGAGDMEREDNATEQASSANVPKGFMAVVLPAIILQALLRLRW